MSDFFVTANTRSLFSKSIFLSDFSTFLSKLLRTARHPYQNENLFKDSMLTFPLLICPTELLRRADQL